MKAASEPELFSVPDIGRQLNVSRSKAWELVYGGAIGSVKIGSRRLVPRRELERYVDRLCAEAGLERAGAPA